MPVESSGDGSASGADAAVQVPDASASLLDGGVQAPDAACHRTAFVTRSKQSGNLSPPGGDGLCNQAAAGKFCGTCRAWLALPDGGEPFDPRGQWRLPNGDELSITDGGMSDGGLRLDQAGAAIVGSEFAWTGMAGATCAGWTSAGANHYGQSTTIGSSGPTWDRSAAEILCIIEAHLYCFCWTPDGGQ